MAKTITPITIATDSFASLITKTNQVITALGSEVITANTSVNGANTTGNTNLIGIFGANTIAVGNSLRGGTVNEAANLTVTSNTIFTGANVAFSSNVVINGSAATINAVTSYVNSPTLTINSNTAFSNAVVFNGPRATFNANTTFNANVNINALNTVISGNNFSIAGNNFSVTANAVSFTSNTTFDGTLLITNTTTVLGDILYGPLGKQTATANDDLGATTGTPIEIYNWLLTEASGSDFTSLIKNNAGTQVRMSRLILASNGTDAYLTEYATVNVPPSANLGQYSISCNTTHARVFYTQNQPNLNINLNITLMA